MNPWHFLIFTPFYLCFLFLSISCTSNSNSSLDNNILLDCGSADSLSFNGKYWTGDVGSKFIPSRGYETSTISVASSLINYQVPKIPYSTARVFPSRFTYAFPLSPGFKFIRLHFYPASSYLGLQARIFYARFAVLVSGNYTLLNNFCPSATANNLQLSYFTKDFVVNLKENVLNITFIPSPKAYAFVNGIEIYKFPHEFYNYTSNVTSGKMSSIPQEPAFEMLHRIDVGGSKFDDGMRLQWVDDSSYILGSMTGNAISTPKMTQEPWNMSEYAAPEGLYVSARTMGSDDAVNLSYNLTWTFLIDPGFKYLVRLHFCEISHGVTEVNQRVFHVYINNVTVEDSLDVIAQAGAPLIAIYKDYVVMVPEGTGERKKLWLALHPNTKSKAKFDDAILNGVEIMKLSDDNNNFAPLVQPEIRKIKKNSLGVIIGGVLGCIGGILISCLIVYQWRKGNCNSRSHDHKNSSMPLMRPSRLCRQFTLADIRDATNNFSKALVIGMGGFGKVYKGSIDGGVTQVAIKRKHPESHQGVHEFETEIDLLSAFRHVNLVSLLGFCQENNELILVYDYMARGTLRDHLYTQCHQPLSWNQRLKICIGAARGLHYLHTGAKSSIIHRDIKSTNILLDEEWVAKVSDFGLSRLGPTTTSSSHVKTEVKGTFGYLDPEYYRSRTLSKKSDVYSFGVVLLEVLCARPAVLEIEEEEDNKVISLAVWASNSYRNGNIDCIIDPFLREKVATASLIMFVEIAVKCLENRRAQRPLMGDVVHSLELALQLQESTDARD